MKLIIAEKPSLGKAIAEWLGIIKKHDRTHIECKNGYIVTWLFGHILELLEPHDYNPEWKSWGTALPIRPTAFKNQLKNDSGIKSQFKVIKELVSTNQEIINAGDPDREGQLLVDEVLEFISNTKPVKRLWLSATDDKSINNAFQNMHDNKKYLGYKLAAETRQQADWLTGINYTRAFTQKFRQHGYSNTISIGRVQTPTLKLIVDRDKAIKNFVAKDFYELKATFNKETPPVTARLIVPEQIKSLMDEEERLLDKVPLEQISAEIINNPGKVESCVKTPRTKRQPALFNLSELQSFANKKLGYSAQTVLDVAQLLYENKLTSYPRTDCQYMPESQFNDAKDILAELVKLPVNTKFAPDASIKSAAWNDSKVTAHHAIIPTGANLSNLEATLSGFGKHKEAATQIFDIICARYITQFYPVMKFDETEIIFSIGEYTDSEIKKPYRFKAIGKIITDKGWTAMFLDEDAEKDEQNEEIQVLPALTSGQTTTCTETFIETKKTTKPKYYTEGTLIKAMANIHSQIPEIIHQLGHDKNTAAGIIKQYQKVLKESAGLGTEATRAGIIETLKRRELIRISKNNLIATDLGHLVVDAISGEKVRDKLSFLASPLTTAHYEQMLDEFLTNSQSSTVSKFWDEFNPQLDVVRDFSNLPFNIPNNPDAKPKAEARVTGDKCPKCNSALVERTGKFGKFIACSNYPTCKYSPNRVEVQTTEKKCPTCKTGMLVIRNGIKGKFFGCNKFPTCKHVEQV